MDFIKSHTERIIMEFGNDLDYIFKKIDSSIVTMSKHKNLEARVEQLEKELVVKKRADSLIERVDITSGQLSVSEDSKTVLLKSTENTNDGAWVHVSSLVKDV